MIECRYCKKEFEPSKYQFRQYKKGIDVYCSRGCATASRYGNSGVVTQDIIDNIKNLFNNTALSYDEIQKLSNLSQTVFAETVKKYNIRRDKSTINELKVQHMQDTMLEKYGVRNAMEVQAFRDNISKTFKEKTDEEKQLRISKIKQTKLERYGNAGYHNIEKAQATMLDRYGVTTGYSTEKSITRRKQTSLEKYGVDNPFKSKEVRDLGKQVIKEKYGVEYALQSEIVKTKAEETNIKRYGHRNAFKNEMIKQKQFDTIKARYGVNYACQTEQCANSSPKAHSQPNERYKKLLNPDKTEVAIDNYRYDMLKGNVLIEVNPTYTHNTYKNPFGKPVSKLYHYNKTYTALINKYDCIHIFDWDNWEKIKYLLQDKQTLYARNLELKEVSVEDTVEFLNKYHLQDSCKGQSIRLGLYKEEELVEVMTFGIPRYNKNYEWELLRLCTKAEYKVVGGAEKLFKHFIEKYEPESIISYCDFSKFTGEVYTRLGFKQKGNPKPSKHWSKGSEHITDNLLRQRGYDQLFNANYGKGTSNEELMLENGWLPIYDCGQLTFVWNKNK